MISDMKETTHRKLVFGECLFFYVKKYQTITNLKKIPAFLDYPHP